MTMPIEVQIMVDPNTQELTTDGIENADVVTISGFEYMERHQAEKTIHTVFAKMKHGSMIEFSVMNFHHLVECYRSSPVVDDYITQAICVPYRRSVWDELSIARTLLLAGFYKVWTGIVVERPPSDVWVKGLKLVQE